MNIPDAVRALDRDLRGVFGRRLRSLVAYQPAVAAGAQDGTPTLAVVDEVTAEDLRACAGRMAAWHDAGLATPLLLGVQEFGRSLDAFPVEFGAILASHVVVSGADPFAGLSVDPSHLRHACEIQARSHLLHLREGYLETRGRGDEIAGLITRSATPLAALLMSVARLHGKPASDPAAAAQIVERELGLASDSLGAAAKVAAGATLTSDAGRRIFPSYLEAVDRLTQYIDRWNGHASP
jgi:hypothetical protein